MRSAALLDPSEQTHGEHHGKELRGNTGETVKTVIMHDTTCCKENNETRCNALFDPQMALL